MKRPIFYIAAFFTAITISASADQPHRTMSNGCVTIAVPTAVYQDALEAGLREWMDMQCVGAKP